MPLQLRDNLGNLNDVLNIIDDPQERAAALAEAWGLAARVMVAAARLNVGGRGASKVELGDGIVKDAAIDLVSMGATIDG